MNLEISIAEASSHQGLCCEFREGHANVLKDIGIESISSSEDEWWLLPGSIIIMIRDSSSKELVAGCRIQIFDGKNQLPVQRAIGYLDSAIDEFVKNIGENRVAEICGLWIASKGRGLRLAHILARTAVVLCKQLNLTSTFIFCSQFTYESAISLGFRHITEIGNKGFFDYPTELFQSSVLIIDDLSLDFNATETDALQMRSLLNNPNEIQVENFHNRTYTLAYNLLSVNHVE